MRAVRGWVTSSEPASLKKAARIISAFAARDNHASQAVTSYLKRAAASFNDLLLLHRELRRSRRPADPAPGEPLAGVGGEDARAFREPRESRTRERKRDGAAAAGGRDKVGIFVKDDEKNPDWKDQKSTSEADVVVSVEEGVAVAVEGGTGKDGVNGGEEGVRKGKRKKSGGGEEQSKKKKRRRWSEEEKS